MVIVWIVVEVMFFMLFFNLPKVQDDQVDTIANESVKPTTYGSIRDGTVDESIGNGTAVKAIGNGTASKAIQNNIDADSGEETQLLSKAPSNSLPPSTGKVTLKEYSLVAVSGTVITVEKTFHLLHTGKVSDFFVHLALFSL